MSLKVRIGNRRHWAPDWPDMKIAQWVIEIPSCALTERGFFSGESFAQSDRCRRR
jgi:hypothetical protein